MKVCTCMNSGKFMRSNAGTCIKFAVVSVLVKSGTTAGLDRRILEWIGPARRPLMTSLMLLASHFGEWKGALPFVAVVGGFLWYRKRSADCIRYVLVGVSGEILYALCKLIFHRPRPTVISHLDVAGWFSYPSGHAMLAPILCGYGFYLVRPLLPSPAARKVTSIVMIAVPLLIAASRVYLGVHYPTDVIGALCIGVGWVLLWREIPDQHAPQ